MRERLIRYRTVEEPTQWFPTIANVECQQSVSIKGRLNSGDVFFKFCDDMITIGDTALKYAVL